MATRPRRAVKNANIGASTSLLRTQMAQEDSHQNVQKKRSKTGSKGRCDTARMVMNREDTDEDEDEDSDDQGGRESPCMHSMSLDVLAQVATATLAKEPRSPLKKLTKRSLQSMDTLRLDQVRQLTDKSLVNLFSEHSSNEIKRNYTFSCCLMPDQSCNETFTSFGNENKARVSMREHLHGHISQLLKSGAKNFVAETVPARIKRLAVLHASKRRSKTKSKPKDLSGYSSKSPTPVSTPSYRSEFKKKSDYTLLKPVTVGPDGSPEKPPEPPKRLKLKSGGNKFKSRQVPLGVNQASLKLGVATVQLDSSMEEQDEAAMEVMNNEIGCEVEIHSAPREVESDSENIDHVQTTADQFVVEILHQKQPFHDHSYTTIFGKRQGVEIIHELIASEDEDERSGISRVSSRTVGTRIQCEEIDNGNTAEDGSLTLKVNAGMVVTVNNIHIPMVKLAQLPYDQGEEDEEQSDPEDEREPAPITVVSSEEVVTMDQGENFHSRNYSSKSLLTSSQPSGSQAHRPYPPMPKTDLAHQGKLHVPEEEASSSDEEYGQLSVAGGRRKRKPQEGTPEWERKMALKCIRELRVRRKEDTDLTCKICKNKVFTATATLLYHYRSHAGIKPFVCLICNTTFTRQHSLNYHMLIHNNQSRFSCNDCGRKFRHPSHFREHLRRHTGETPFHCSDCNLRFKTRNTYKRHLRTRHGKLLTATGICSIPEEEFRRIQERSRRSPDDMGDDYDEDEEEGEIDSDNVEETVVLHETIDQPNVITEVLDQDSSTPNKLLQFCTQVVNKAFSQEMG